MGEGGAITEYFWSVLYETLDAVWSCLFLLRFLKHTQTAPATTSNPATPPRLAPILVPLLGCAGGVAGAAVGEGRIRVGLRVGYEATAPKHADTLLSSHP